MTDPRQELESALSPLAWILNFIWDTIRLMFWFFMSPILIITWCFHHPVEARLYVVSAIPLLWAEKTEAATGLLAGCWFSLSSLSRPCLGRPCIRSVGGSSSWLSSLA